MSDFFEALYIAIKKKKIISLMFFLGLLGMLVFLSSKIAFEEDITKLIPSSEKSSVINKVLKHVNFADKIIVNISTNTSTNEEELTRYATQLVDSLERKCNAYIKEIQGTVGEDQLEETLGFVYEHLPVFLDDADYDKIKSKLAKDSITKRTAANYRTLISPTGIIARNTILKDPLGLTFMGLEKLKNLKIGDDFELHNGFLLSKNRKNILLFITPSLATNETDNNALFVTELYAIQQQLNMQFMESDIRSEYYGSTVIAVANATQIKTDIQFTVSIALSILLVILIVFYKKISIPLLLFMPTLFGGLLAVVVLALLKESVSAISLGIGAILLGITLDYSLHVLTHYRNNPNLTALYKDVTKPILMSSCTTAVAFLCLVFVKSEALQDLGIFAAVSVLGASLFALVLIPQLYHVKDKKQKEHNTLIDKFANYKFHKSKLLITIGIVLFLISIFTFTKVGFNTDLAKMNFQTAALKAAEKRLDTLLNTQSKSIYVTTYGKSTEEALTANNTVFSELKSLKSSSKILGYSSIGGVVLSAEIQKQKIEKWNDFWKKEIKDTLKANLIRSGDEYGFKTTTFSQFYNLLNTSFETISFEEYSQMQNLFVNEFVSNKAVDFSTVVSLVKVEPENLKEVVQHFSSAKQTVVIDRQHINETFLGSLKASFNKLIGYSLIAVLLILMLFFRNIELTVITIIPIGITWLITSGIMGLFGMEFNIFNIIISTFIFGLGVDFSIFMTNGLQKKYTTGKNVLPTYRASIILSVITTLLSVGVLIFAKHPALRSISIISIIGIVTAVFISFTLQPLLFKAIISGRAKKGLAPLRLRTTLHSLFLLSFYAGGGVLLSLFSISILKLIPISKKIKMKWLHGVISKFVAVVLKINPFVKKKVSNPNKENFSKPAVIIANHSSSLDTLCLGMLTPKIIYLVNDWVYKSPVFGILARVAGFYPVSNGVDNSLDHLREKIRQGYSLVIFPEGKRSMTNKVGRFHKGAFHIANELNLDILPIYIHGVSEVMPKNDMIIHDGAITIHIGDRILPTNIIRKGTDREVTKLISSFYKTIFIELKKDLEHEDYFKYFLLNNYRYKNIDVFNNIKQDFETNKTGYHQLLAAISRTCKIAHISNDYGQLAILLVYQSLDRKITACILDKEKLAIASNCYISEHRKVSYVDDLLEVTRNSASVLLISKSNVKREEIEMLDLSLIETVFLWDNMSLIDYFQHQKYTIRTKSAYFTEFVK